MIWLDVRDFVWRFCSKKFWKLENLIQTEWKVSQEEPEKRFSRMNFNLYMKRFSAVYFRGNAPSGSVLRRTDGPCWFCSDLFSPHHFCRRCHHRASPSSLLFLSAAALPTRRSMSWKIRSRMWKQSTSRTWRKRRYQPEVLLTDWASFS